MANNKLFEKQQRGENTDVSFVFIVPSEDGQTSTEKIIHAHKLILTSVSAFFETNFKEEWNKGDRIPITTVDYEIFEKLIKIVYLNYVSLESLDEAAKIYDAAHFYQMKDVLVLIRDDVPRIWFQHKTVVIGKLLNTAMKCQDWTILQFCQKVFNANATTILGDNDGITEETFPHEDWYTYSPEVINFLYASYDILTAESNLLKALEHYVERTTVPLDLLKPAIKSIDCQDISAAQIAKITCFDADAKYLFCQNRAAVAGKAKRNKRTFFKELPSKIQWKLIEVFDSSSKAGVSVPNGPIQSKDVLINFLELLKTQDVPELKTKYSDLVNFDLKKEFEDSFFVV